MPTTCLNIGNGRMRNPCYLGGKTSKRPVGLEWSSEGRAVRGGGREVMGQREEGQINH